jgi:hypothetical protein
VDFNFSTDPLNATLYVHDCVRTELFFNPALPAGVSFSAEIFDPFNVSLGKPTDYWTAWRRIIVRWVRDLPERCELRFPVWTGASAAELLAGVKQHREHPIPWPNALCRHWRE